MPKLLTLNTVGMTTALMVELGDSLSEADIYKRVKLMLDRHTHGDWGNVDPHDAKENEKAVKNGDRILSVFEVEGTEIWVISDPAWDRSKPGIRQTTTVMRRADY
jgi:hypothetical protein